MKKIILILLTLFSGLCVAQQYSLSIQKQDIPEYKHDFSTVSPTGWPTEELNTKLNVSYYYENGKFIIDYRGEGGVGVYKSFNDPTKSGLTAKFAPFSNSYKYIEAEFKLLKAEKPTIEYGLFFGKQNGSGYDILITQEGKFQIRQQYYSEKENQTERNIIQAFTPSKAIKKGLDAINIIRAEVDDDNVGAISGIYVYNFYVNNELVYSHTDKAIQGADIQFTARGGKSKLEVDNVTFGKYTKKIITPPLTFANHGDLAKILIDESLDINQSITNLINESKKLIKIDNMWAWSARVFTDIKIGNKTYQLERYLREKPSNLTYKINNTFSSLQETNEFIRAFVDGLSSSNQVQELSKSYKVLENLRYPFFTKGEGLTKRGVVSINTTGKKDNLTIEIEINYNNKPFVIIPFEKGNEGFHKGIREILGTVDVLPKLKGKFIQSYGDGNDAVGSKYEYYEYNGNSIKNYINVNIRKTSNWSEGDKYDLISLVYEGPNANAKEEYIKWISYISNSLGKSYVIVPLHIDLSENQLVNSSPYQAIAFRSKDLMDRKFIKLILANEELILNFAVTKFGENIDNDDYEQKYD